MLPPQGHKYILWKNKTDKYTSLDNWVRLRGGICPRCGQPIVEQMREKELKEVERANKKGSNYNPKISSKYYSKLNPKKRLL